MAKPSRPFVLTLVLISTAFVWFLRMWAIPSSPPNTNVNRCQSQLQRLYFALEVYRVELGQALSRNTPETLDMLTGGNASHRRFLDRQAFRTSPAGTCLDPWGTPYRITIETTTTKVRSAGPDRVMFTPDDVVPDSPEP